MASTLRIKRSAVPGKAPAVADLSLGELALNTFDGKLYTLKDDGAQSVVELSGGSGGGGNAPAQYYASFRPSTSTQSIDTAYARTIDFDEIVFRSGNWPLEIVNPNGYVYVPITGKYLVTVSIYVDTTTVSVRNAMETSLYSTSVLVNRAMSYAYSPNNSYYYASTHMSAIISVTNVESWGCYATALFNSVAGSTVGNVSQDSRLNIVYLGE